MLGFDHKTCPKGTEVFGVKVAGAHPRLVMLPRPNNMHVMRSSAVPHCVEPLPCNSTDLLLFFSINSSLLAVCDFTHKVTAVCKPRVPTHVVACHWLP